MALLTEIVFRLSKSASKIGLTGGMKEAAKLCTKQSLKLISSFSFL
jgi:hypothetical protein